MSYAERDKDDFSIGDMDRTEYIKSQMAAHPDYRDRIADEMFRNPGAYPIFSRERIEDGFEMGLNPETGEPIQWKKYRPGPVQFKGWMTPEQHWDYLAAIQSRRQAEAQDG